MGCETRRPKLCRSMKSCSLVKSGWAKAAGRYIGVLLVSRVVARPVFLPGFDTAQLHGVRPTEGRTKGQCSLQTSLRVIGRAGRWAFRRSTRIPNSLPDRAAVSCREPAARRGPDMARRTLAVLPHLRRALAGAAAAPGDAQLLEGFLARPDPEAFAALVRRHGPMVLALCRRLLPD